LLGVEVSEGNVTLKYKILELTEMVSESENGCK
jgi:hypothetical protein